MDGLVRDNASFTASPAVPTAAPLAAIAGLSQPVESALYLWGYNLRGQTSHRAGLRGDPRTWRCQRAPLRIAREKFRARDGQPVALVSVACGLEHSAAVGIDGSLFTWGSNEYGQLGDGTEQSSRCVDSVDSIDLTFSLGIDGSLSTCGSNEYGQLGDGAAALTALTPALLASTPPLFPSFSLLSVLFFSLVPRFSYREPIRLATLGEAGEEVTAVACGAQCTAAITPFLCDLPLSPSPCREPIKVPALDEAGEDVTAVACGAQEPIRVAALEEAGEEVTAVACGAQCTAAITRRRADGRGRGKRRGGNAEHGGSGEEEGRLWVWGQNQNSNLPRLMQGAFPPKTVVVQVSCGDSHAAAVSNSGLLQTWGYNEHGQLGIGRACDGLQKPHLVTSFQRFLDDPPLTCPHGVRIVAVACGGFHTAAVDARGEMYTWGGGLMGQLGHRTLQARGGTCEVVPRRVVALEGVSVTQVACGRTHTCALTHRGALYIWGAGRDGQLGTGPTSGYMIRNAFGFHRVSLLPSFFPICNPTLIRPPRGALYIWGAGRDGQLGTGPTSASSCSSLEPIPTAPLPSSLRLPTPAPNPLPHYRGALYIWGAGRDGQLGTGPTSASSAPTSSSSSLPSSSSSCPSFHHLHTGFTSNTTASSNSRFGGPFGGGFGAGASGGGCSSLDFVRGLVQRQPLLLMPKGVRLVTCGQVRGWGRTVWVGIWSRGARGGRVLISGLRPHASGDGRRSDTGVGLHQQWAGIGLVPLCSPILSPVRADHTLVAMADDQILGWGYNSCGQAATGRESYAWLPMHVDWCVGKVQALAAGGGHSAVLTAADSLKLLAEFRLAHSLDFSLRRPGGLSECVKSFDGLLEGREGSGEEEDGEVMLRRQLALAERIVEESHRLGADSLVRYSLQFWWVVLCATAWWAFQQVFGGVKQLAVG
ncbi:unnamed protein product [Closterium sp. Naga37s-1]|nr:unnamed protein product [Closterium sp. Naga37s-1]